MTELMVASPVETGRQIMSEIFNNHTIRFVDDGDRWVSLTDIRNAIGIDRSTSGKIVKRIESTFPGCSRVDVASTLGETDPLRAIQKETVLNKEGVVHYFQMMHVERLSNPNVKANCIAFQKWVATFIGNVLSGDLAVLDTPAVTAHSIASGIYLQQLKIGKEMVRSHFIQTEQMHIMALKKAEVDSGVDLSCWYSIIPQEHVFYDTLNATEIGEQLEPALPARKVNMLLQEHGFIRKIGEGEWEITDKGIQYGKSVPVHKSLPALIASEHNPVIRKPRWMRSIVDVLQQIINPDIHEEPVQVPQLPEPEVPDVVPPVQDAILGDLVYNGTPIRILKGMVSTYDIMRAAGFTNAHLQHALSILCRNYPALCYECTLADLGEKEYDKSTRDEVLLSKKGVQILFDLIPASSVPSVNEATLKVKMMVLSKLN